MQTINIRHLFYIFRIQIAIIGIITLFPLRSSAQFFSDDIDNSDYYFGITLGGTVSTFNLQQSAYFLQQDSIQVAEPLNNGGLNMGFRATLRITDHFDLRANPTLIFTSRNIQYTIIDSTTVIQKIESALIDFPIQAVLNSDRIGNMRVYAFTGLKFDDDLSSNSADRKADDIIKLAKYDFGYELGFGFHFYFPAFVLSPEIKVSNGFRNLLVKTPGLNYSDAIDKLKSHMIIFSLNFE
jgi:Outer membrane protein beta-barrel domain